MLGRVPSKSNCARAVCAAIAGFLLVAPGASADKGGGAGLPDPPALTKVECMPTKRASCPTDGALVRGGKLRAVGSGLANTATIQFNGSGASARLKVRPAHTGSRHVEARVPRRAQTGPVVVVSKDGVKTRKRVKVTAPLSIAPPSAKGSVYYFGDRRKPTFDPNSSNATELQVIRESDGAVVRVWQLEPGKAVSWDGLGGGKAQPSGKYRFRALRGGAVAADSVFWLYDHVFPIRGKHNLGYTETNNFGGGRNHKGQDLFAACGTPLVAIRSGKVKYSGYQGDAGNYIVVDEAGTGYDYAYMHLRRPALVKTGDRVYTGQPVGEVGETGNAQGCHLHFEYWTAPGWWSGGKPIDPLPMLKAWDSVS